MSERAAGKLAIVTNDYPPKPGGIQQYLGNLVDAYPGDVCVLAPSDGPASGTRRGEAVVSRHERPFMWPTPSVRGWLEAELRAHAPDYVLFGAPHPLPALTRRLQRTIDVPVGVLCHGAEVTLPAAFPGSRQVLAHWLRTADVRFAVSRFTRRRVERLTGRDVVYIGAGVDAARFVGPASAANDVPRVGCISRFVPRKGQRRLIDAVAVLRRSGTECELLLVGKGRTEARLRRHAERTGVPVRFEIDVSWDDLPQHFASLDVFCMPCRSRWGGLEIEGLGLVFLEAAAAGVPVLAGDSGGSPETVVPGETGFVVRSVADIVDGIEMLLADPKKAGQMGQAGRARVEQEFTWEKVAERLIEGFGAASPRDRPST